MYICTYIDMIGYNQRHMYILTNVPTLVYTINAKVLARR